MDALFIAIQAARVAHREGLLFTTDTHLRMALAAANRLKRRDYTAAVMRCRNRLRPALVRMREVV